MSEDIRIAIIGHGFMGHEHEKMLTNFPGIRLVGFADKDPEQLKDVGEGLKRYGSNEELLADPEVDVVIIAANNNQHHDLVIQAAKAHKDIICEKPVAMSLAELDDMEAAVKENGSRFISREGLIRISARQKKCTIPAHLEMCMRSRISCTALMGICMTGTYLKVKAAGCCMTGVFIFLIRSAGCSLAQS